MGEVKEKGFELPTGIVTVKFIKKAKGLAANVKDDHIISGGLLEGATRRFSVPMLRNGGLKNVLNKEEKDFLEAGPFMGVNLSVYGEFWKDYYVRLGKTDLSLDLSNPEDYLKYKLLLAWDQVVAPSLEAYNKTKRASYQFYMVKEGEEKKVLSKSLSVTKKAWKLYAKIEDNRDILISILNLLSGKKVSGNSSIDFIRTEVETLVNTRQKDFVAIMEDADFETKSLIALAENAGIIVKKSGRYETIDGLKLANQGENATLKNTVKFLNSPKNLEVVELIKARLENTKE